MFQLGFKFVGQELNPDYALTTLIFTFSTQNGTCGQINFDGKLLQDLDGGFEKVTRLAVVAV